MISYEEALAQIGNVQLLRDQETLPLIEASGRRLAQPVIANVNRPMDTLSAMDGYAARLDDVSRTGASLTVIGEAPAGRPFEGEVGKGDAVRIFTGGVLPAKADHVLIQEEVSRDGDVITTQCAYAAPAYVRPIGMDFKAGDALIPSEHLLDPASIGLAAAANTAEFKVWKKPRIGILTSGDELKPVGSDLKRGDVINSNSVTLIAAIEAWGGEPVDLGVVGDTQDAICAAVETSNDIDLFLPIGGASVGDHDLMRPAFASLGFEPIFDKVAVRPGKPTWLARRGETYVLGLPGNPASAYVCALLFLKPLLQGHMNKLYPVRLDAPMKANGPRAHFMRATVKLGPAGAFAATPAPNQDSSLIWPLVRSNALLFRPANAEALQAGEEALAMLTREFL
ncbi:MAG: molybdopterin molybdotransferase MoeA [Pseudomonadota bacterium]